MVPSRMATGTSRTTRMLNSRRLAEASGGSVIEGVSTCAPRRKNRATCLAVGGSLELVHPGTRERASGVGFEQCVHYQSPTTMYWRGPEAAPRSLVGHLRKKDE